MNKAARSARITPADRLSLTFCLAVICHAIVVLGITFTEEDISQSRFSTMDIILVQQKSKSDDDAQLLAQASMEGGGEEEEEVTPSSPLPPPFPDNQPEVAAPPAADTPPQQAMPAQTAAEPVEQPADSKELMAVEGETSETNLTMQQETKKENKPDEKASKKPQKESRASPKPSATSLLANSLKIAALSARIDRQLVAKAERPKRKFISASTREYNYAAYMEAWRAKVERVGNLNYPEEARRRKLSGSLVLDVALNPDGSINSITVRHPSGHKILDDAAIRIVRLSAPFAPFPDAIREETDILHIIRTWQFLKKGSFR